MELLLLKDVEKLGRRGAVVQVARGYARNYLLRRGLAIPATPKNRAAAAAAIARESTRRDLDREQASEVAARLSNVALTFTKRCNEKGELYGGVTAAEIVAALAEHGFDIGKNQVSFDEPVTRVGLFMARVKLAGDVEAPIPLTVLRSEE